MKIIPCSVAAGIAFVACSTSIQAQRNDIGKFAVEGPLKAHIAASRNFPAPKAASLENPKVLPGFVRWHSSFEAAKTAAKRSGKPILLFQLLGKLDDEFC